MIEFIFMLTHHDRTVPHAEQVLADVAGTGLRLVGCKDVGATPSGCATSSPARTTTGWR